MTKNYDQSKIFENKFIVQRVVADLNQANNILFVYKIPESEAKVKNFGNKYSIGYIQETNTSTLVQRISLDVER